MFENSNLIKKLSIKKIKIVISSIIILLNGFIWNSNVERCYAEISGQNFLLTKPSTIKCCGFQILSLNSWKKNSSFSWSALQTFFKHRGKKTFKETTRKSRKVIKSNRSLNQFSSLIEKISELKETQKVYDLIEVASDGHRYYTNNIVSHNCDEMAFIPNRVQNEFMAGTAPALSATRGKMIVTSTPNGSRDLFAKLWFGAGMAWDKKEYTYLRDNSAVKNLFTPLFIPYWIDPTKNNDEWINREKKTLDDPIKWRVEFECLSEDTTVDVYDQVEQVFKTIRLDEMYKILVRDEIDNKVIITCDSEIVLPESIAKYI